MSSVTYTLALQAARSPRAAVWLQHRVPASATTGESVPADGQARDARTLRDESGSTSGVALGDSNAQPAGCQAPADFCGFKQRR